MTASCAAEEGRGRRITIDRLIRIILMSMLIIDINIEGGARSMTWLTAEQALAILGGKRQTLYANVSRGRIRARPDPEDSRRSLYHRADIAALAGRRRGRRSAATVAAEAIGWGEPVLSSSVSAVVDCRLLYRGRDAIQLAQEAALEDVADLLWQVEGTRFPGERARSDGGADVAATAMRALANRLDAAAPCIGRSGPSLATEAARLVGVVAAAVLGERGTSAKRLHDESRAPGRSRPPKPSRSAKRSSCWPNMNSTPRVSRCASPPPPERPSPPA